MTGEIVVGILILAVIGLAVWRPEAVVMGLGVFLFIQSGLARFEPLGPEVRELVRRADEIVLVILVVRLTFSRLLARSISIPTPLWALAAFCGVGLVSTVVNAVNPLQASVGIFLAIKAGLWMFVGRNLTIRAEAVVRYAYIVGALFLAVIAIAGLQVLGVDLPWEPGRRSGQVAATSIWNQHTAFGAALTVGVGLAIAGLRLPGERTAAAFLLLASGAGIIMSTVRRILVSMPLAGIATLALVPASRRAIIESASNLWQRRLVFAAVAVLLVAGVVLLAPRMISLASFTWERYIVELEERDRYLLYEGAYQLVRESPLLGRGPGTYGSHASVVFDSEAYEEVGFTRRASVRMAAPYGSLIAEYGILGTLAFAAFVVLLFRALLPVARRTVGSVHAALALAGIFMLGDMVIESVVNPVFSNSFITFFVFLAMGAALALHRPGATGAEGAWNPRLIGARWRLGSLAAAGTLVASLALLLTVFVDR